MKTDPLERIDGARPSPVELTIERAATGLDEAAHWMETSMPFRLRYIENARPEGMDNVLFSPGEAKGGAVNIVYGTGYWNLADDEAWLITFDQPDAFHWSGDLAHAQTSLNDRQCHVDADGRVRVVVSHRDPGVPNWIDTEGRPVAMVAYRWIWATTTPTPDGEVTALEAVADAMPDDHPHVDEAALSATLSARRKAVHRRFRR